LVDVENGDADPRARTRTAVGLTDVRPAGLFEWIGEADLRELRANESAAALEDAEVVARDRGLPARQRTQVAHDLRAHRLLIFDIAYTCVVSWQERLLCRSEASRESALGKGFVAGLGGLCALLVAQTGVVEPGARAREVSLAEPVALQRSDAVVVRGATPEH